MSDSRVCRMAGLLFGLFAVVTFSRAAYLQDVPMSVQQPDGTRLACFASGDEFHNWLHDRDGFTIIQDPNTGFYMYAVRRDERLQPSQVLPGRDDPRAAGLRPNINLSEEEILDRRNLADFQAPQAVALAPRTGYINNIVIFIRFSDEGEFTAAPATYDNMFNTSTPGVNSLRNFFYEVSYGKLEVSSTFYPTPTGATVLSFQDGNPRAYYMPYSTTNTLGYSSSQRSQRELTLLTNAVAAVTAQIPAGLIIDSDNDSYVDNVCFIVKGTPTAWSTLLWPHMSSMSGSGVLLAGKKVAGYNFQIESKANVGVFCHEMMHTLGAPDLYRYASPDLVTPVGSWDVMASTLNPPQHPGAYVRARYMSWISGIPRISASGVYSLRPVSAKVNNCYRIDSPNPGEFFLLEYRKKTSVFENSLPGEGLVVYRIDSLVSGNAGGPPDGVYVYRPGGNPGLSGPQNGTLSSAAFNSTVGRISINDTTNPACYLTSGALGNLDISQVGAPGDSIFFTVKIHTKNPGWTKVTVPTTKDLNAISFADRRSGWIVGASVVLRSADAGSSWSSLTNAPKVSLFSLSALDSLRCWATSAATIYKTTNGGASWSSVDVTVPSGGRLTAITMVSPADGWCVGSGGIVYRTTNGGSSWTLVNAGVTGKLNGLCFLSATKGWIVGDLGTVLMTSDGGNSWYQQALGDTTALLAVTFTDTSRGVTVGRLGHIFQTTERGTDWTRLMMGTSSHLNAVKFSTQDSGWAVGENGTVFVTSDGGSTWSGDLSGTTLSLKGLAALDATTQWIVGSGGTLLRSIPGSVTDVEGLVAEVPQGAALMQNYPNPFNPTTTIRFTIAGVVALSGSEGPATKVRLVVYDLLGREVAVLVNEKKEPGTYNVEFNAGNLASGVYIYRLETASYMEARKMLILR